MAASNGASNKTVDARYEAFAREYVIDHNGTRAYMKVYGVEDAAVAGASAPRLLVKVRVKRMIARLEAEVHKKLEITKEKVERELASMAFVDTRDFYKDDGTFKRPREWTREMASMVAGFDVQETFMGTGKDRVWTGYLVKVKFWDRQNANIVLGGPHGIGVKRVETGDPNAFKDTDANAVRRRIVSKAAKRGVIVKFPGRKLAVAE